MMSIPIWLAAGILGTHFVADFMVQTDWQAVNKSKSLNALARHVGTYSLCLLWLGPKFAIINGVAHFAVDFFTSKRARMWAGGKRHDFFVVIGADQYIHECCLLASAGVAWWAS
jgi:hypothetical protein